MFHVNFVKIPESDCDKNAYFSKIFKHLLKNHKGDEADTFHT